MTTIHFERTGGALGDDINTNLNLAEMPFDEAQNLQNLIMQSDFFELPVDMDGGSPDEFHYVITVKAAQSEHTVRVSDTKMPEQLSPLVAALSTVHEIGSGRGQKR
jgi:hypothetical protein